MTAAIPVREMAMLLQPLDAALVDAPSLAAYLQFIGHPVDDTQAEQIRTAVGPATSAVFDAFDRAAADEFDADSATTVARAGNDLLDALARQVALAEGGDPALVYDGLLYAALRDYLGRRTPFVVAALEALGVIVEPNAPPTAGAPRPLDSGKVEFHWRHLGEFLRDTSRWAAEMYGWGVQGSGAFDHLPAMARIAKLVETLQIATTHVRPLTAAEALVLLGPQTAGGQVRVDLPLFQTEFVDVDPTGEPRFAAELGMSVLPFITGFALSPLLIGTATTDQSLSDGVEVAATVDAEIPVDTQALLAVTPAGMQTFLLNAAGHLTPADLSFRVDGTLTYRRDAVPLWTVGAPSGTHVLATGMRFAVSLRAPTEIVVSVSVLGLTVVVALDDDLLRSLLDAPVRLSLGDIAFGYSTRSGGFVDAALPDTGTLTRSFPLNVSAGPVRVARADVVLRFAAPASGGVRLTASAGVAVAVHLGPVWVALETPGIAASLDLSATEDGPFDYAFVPPTGAAIEVAAGPISGGGSIDYDPVTGRYSGGLALRFLQTNVRAGVVLDTRPPGGGNGFSLVVVLHAEFPAIQLGFGFALTGVGGLIAVNRRVDVDALKQRLAAGAAGRILDPPDPLRNAAALFDEIAAVFPAAPGVHVVGPTVQLLWAGLVQFNVGVFLELPGPTRVVILGSARAEIARGDRRYLSLRVDIVGEVDLQKRIAAFDAVLIDSRLLDVFDVTGGAAFRLSWGDQPYSVLSVGGFRPGYNPEPLVFPASLSRITMVRGRPTDALYLRLEGYFAITSNTMQFGAAVEAIINAGNFNIRGTIEFHALIQFQPFHFQADIRASVYVRYRSHNLAGLTLTGSLSGPGPVTLHVKVCVELLFFDVCFEDTFHLGAAEPPPITTVAGALEALTDELDEPANLHASETTDPYVTVRPPTPEVTVPVVSPLGHLSWTQRRAPLGLLLQRIGGIPLAAPRSVVVGSPQFAGTELDWFAPGSFADLSDAEALNRKGFERLTGGVRFGADGTDDGPAAAAAVTVNQLRIPAAALTPDLHPPAFPAWFTDAVQARTGAAAARPGTPALQVTEETWSVTDRLGVVAATGLSPAQAHQIAAVRGTATAIARSDQLAEFTF
ncbi:hypothetical protein OG426_09845 [Streptomyces canus]|uniref:DUF6603 domain-containing protein n=1 Tax=Streptomyces canus TaxID=58343 RepID=UPI00386E638B|nr:hypothetical protein OG426_09845 [Streptomyces canus]